MAFIRMNYLSRALGIQNNVCLCLPDIEIAASVPSVWNNLTLLHDAGENGDLVMWYTNVLLYAQTCSIAVILPPCVRDDWRNIPNEAQYEDYLLTELPQTCADFIPMLAKGKKMMGGFGIGAAAALRLGLRSTGKYDAILCASPCDDSVINDLPYAPTSDAPVLYIAPDGTADDCDAKRLADKLRNMGYDTRQLSLPPLNGWARRDAVIKAFLTAIS